jgi:hypothetical protein
MIFGAYLGMIGLGVASFFTGIGAGLETYAFTSGAASVC